MFFFKRTKREQEIQKIEKRAAVMDEQAEIKVQIANQEMKKLEKLINEVKEKNDVTLKLFIATGGDRRMK